LSSARTRPGLGSAEPVANMLALQRARIKFGPDFQKEMLSLDQQSKVLQLNLQSVFGGLKIEGLLGALQKMIALFDDTTESGKTIKVVFESLFQPLIDGVTDSQYAVERFFIQFENWSLRALIALKQHWGEAKIALEVFAFVVGGVLVAAFGALAIAVLAATWPILAIGVAIGSAGFLIYELIQHFDDLFNALDGFIDAAGDFGENLVEGIANGIKAAAGAVWNALTGVISDAWKGAKDLLGIHSPSRVMAAEIGAPMGEGVAVGLDQSAPSVNSSLSSLVAPPAAPQSSPQAGAGGGRSLSITGPFIFHGVKDAEDAEHRFGEFITRLWEGDVAQLGGAVPQTNG